MPLRRLLGFALLLLPFAAAAAEPIRVTGRVLTGERGPGLAGARVELFLAYEGYADAVRRLTEKTEPAPLAKGRTNAEGSFEILAPESGCFRVVVQAEGHLSEEIALLPLVEDTALPTTTLLKASSVEVRTVGSDGRPIPGIEVRMVTPEAWASRFEEFAATQWNLRSSQRISDGSGRALLPWSPMFGPPTVAAVSPRFLGQTGTTASARDPITLRLTSSRPTWIEVRGTGGKPMPGALARWKGWPVGMTGPDGRMEIASAPKPEVNLESPEGWRARFFSSGEKGILPVRLEPRRRITGRIVDPQNRPVAGAVIWSGWPLVAPPVRSDATGAFLIEVPAGEEIWLQAGAAGFVRGERRLIQQAAAKPVTLTLAPAATLSGIVVDRGGRLVAGAEIVLHRMARGPEQDLHALSGADGRFRFTGLHPDATFRLRATRTGFARTEAMARTAASGQPSPPARIVMEDGQTAFGRIVDSGGRPIEGVEVKLLTYTALVTRSDMDGRFEFRHLSPGRLSVIATHPGYAPGSLDHIELPAKTPAFDLGTLRLPPGEVIEGRVTDNRGSPIAGAHVIAVPERRGPPLYMLEATDHKPFVTESDGSFRLENLEGGKRFNLRVQRAGYADVSLPGVPAPTEEPLQIEMKPARALSGQVVGPEGEPVADALISSVTETRIGESSSRGSHGLGRTDPEGRFRVTGLTQGSLDLEVSAEGYTSRRLQGLQIPADKDLEGLRIVLQRGALLDVQVLTATGEPVSNVWVHAEPVEQPAEQEVKPPESMHQHTDFSGRCRLTVPVGTYWVSASRMALRARTQVSAGPGRTAVELRLPAGTEVSGRVMDAEGAPVAGASVSLKVIQEGGRFVSTQADGTFSFFEVTEGTYQLTGVQAGLTSETLEVTVSGNPVKGLALRLDRERPGATLTGRVIGLPPEDLAQLFVSAFGGGERIEPVRPDRQGFYRFERLPPGIWRIGASLFDGRSRSGRLEITPADTAVELDLDFSSGLTLRGRVSVDGTPLSGAQVQAWSREQRAPGTGTAYDGSFTLSGLAAGPTTLIVTGPQGLGGTRSLRVTEDQEISIDLATGRLNGRISSVTGEPVEDATIRLDAWVPALKLSFSGPGARTGAEGAFDIPRIGAGTYQLTISKEGFAPAELTVEVPAGREETVEVQLSPVP